MYFLIYKTINVDELTNSCYIGQLDRITYFLFVILPETDLVLIGVTFLALTLASLLRVHGELKNFSPIPPGVTMKAIRTPANRRRLLKAFNRAVFTVVCVAGPLLLGIVCNLWQYFDHAAGGMAIRLLKAVSAEMVGIGATLVLWCNYKTIRMLCRRGKNKQHQRAGNCMQFQIITSPTKGEIIKRGTSKIISISKYIDKACYTSCLCVHCV